MVNYHLLPNKNYYEEELGNNRLNKPNTHLSIFIQLESLTWNENTVNKHPET